MEMSIVVISYNTQAMTLACIESIYEQASSSDFEVVVFDNNSQDGSADAIAEQYPRVRLIRSVENIGFAQGNNAAIEQIESEYVLLLNPDTVVLDHAVDKLLAFAKQNSEAGIWGGRTLFGDRSLNPGSCYRKMSLWNQFCRASGLAGVFKHNPLFHSEHYGGWNRDSVRSVDIVCGCFFLIKLELWKRLGGFDRRFFMYAEEADLCLRARKLGFYPMVCPEATIVHYGGASETVRADKMVRLISAKIELQRVHWPKWQQPVGRWLFKGWVLNRFAFYKLMSSFMPNSGFHANLTSWREIWRRREEWVMGYSREV